MIEEKEFGELIATVKISARNIEKIAENVESILESQAATEERLRAGNKRFEAQETVNKETNAKLFSHDIEFEKMPGKKATYSLITIGFLILGALITFYKFLG